MPKMQNGTFVGGRVELSVNNPAFLESDQVKDKFPLHFTNKEAGCHTHWSLTRENLTLLYANDKDPDEPALPCIPILLPSLQRMVSKLAS